MARFTPAFLDELRDRVTLSDIVAADITLAPAGRERKACCPFHGEKTPSFYVNDDKGFWHCFGCSAHGDAIRWLTDYRGLEFLDAVAELAGTAGMELPARSEAAAERARLIEGQRPTLEEAERLFREQLSRYPAPAAWLAARGIDAATVAAFGIGFAPEDGALRGRGFSQRDLVSVGLVGISEAKDGRPPFAYPRFRSRIMIPIHDARGRIVGFGGRALEGVAKDGAAKWINPPGSEIFDKGRLLFNLHRARARFRCGQPGDAYRGTGRLCIVEGYLDAAQLERIGLAAVGPMGTALTEDQLQRAWRVDPCPLLLFDGDDPGRKAARRACEMMLPLLGPGRSMTIALLPGGMDPDDIVRAAIDAGEDPGMAMAVAALWNVNRVDQLLYDHVVREQADPVTGEHGPEAVAGIWHALSSYAAAIVDEEYRLTFLATWRARYEREFIAAPSSHPIAHKDAHLTGVWDETNNYFWPDPVDDGERQLIRFLREKLAIRAERKALTQRGRDVDAMAKMLGLSPQALNRVCADIEADPEVREEKEAVWALYRRVAGVRGPMQDAMMPSIVDGRAARGPSVGAKRLARVEAMIEGGV